MLLGHSVAVAQSDQELFDKVFGKKTSKARQQTEVRVISQRSLVGELPVEVSALGDLIFIKKTDLIKIMSPTLSESGLKKFETLAENLSPENLTQLGVEANYDSKTLTLFINLPTEFQKAQVSSWRSDIPIWAKNSMVPSPWSLAINTSLRQDFAYGDVEPGADNSETSGDMDGAFQFHRFVLEGSTHYSSNEDRFRRGDIRIVRDFPSHLLRSQLGDLVYPVMNLQSALALGGLSFSRESSLDPYRIVTPLNDQEFYLKSKSLVKVYVNGQLVRSIFLPSGRHSLLDLPLNNGVNEIRLDIRDFYGEESTITFKRFTSTKLLRAGFDEYSFNLGVLRTEDNGVRHYDEDHYGAIFNSFWRRGINSYWTTGAFVLTNDERSNLGIENTLSTEIGVWSHELSYSRAPENPKGVTSRFEYTYQLSSLEGVGSRYQFTHEWVSPHYQNFLDLGSYSELAHRLGLHQGIDLSRSLSANLGLNYSFYRSGSPGFGGSLSTSWRFTRNWLISSYVSKDRDNAGKWRESYYFFLTWNIPEGGQTVTASVDGQNKLQRLDWISSPYTRLGSLESRGSVQNTQDSTTVDFNGSYLASRAQLSFDQGVTHSKNSGQTYARSGVGASFGVGLVPGGFAIGRPIRGSFAVLSPHPELEGSVIGVGTSQLEGESEINSFGSALLPELTPYQYTMLSFDARELDPGLDIGDESIVLFPGYRTGHYVTVGSGGVLMATGHFVRKRKGKLEPVALKVGKVISPDGVATPFFTDRSGQYFLENLSPGIYQILIEGVGRAELDLSRYQRGLIEIPERELK